MQFLSNETKGATRFLPACALLAAATLALVVLYRSPYSASNFGTVPDSQEYAIGAHRLVTDGVYRIDINGRDYPPRYTPWFSLLVIAPVYRLVGLEPGNAILPVTFFGILGVVIAFGLGRRISGTWGGVMAGLSVLALPVYYHFSRQVMTDVPAATLLLVAALWFLRIAAQPSPSAIAFLTAGLIIALATAIRTTSIVALLPFLWHLHRHVPARGRLLRMLFVAAPTAAIAVLTLLYNRHTFGGAWRSGYSFWCPVPYDYPSLSFSLSYVPDNLIALFLSGLPFFAAAVYLIHLVILRLDREFPAPALVGFVSLKPLLTFACWTILPMAAFHGLYFYADWRFFLPGTLLLATIAGAMIGVFASQWSAAFGLLLQVILIALALWARQWQPDPIPEKRLVADTIAHQAATHSLVLSAIDPVYLGFMTRQAGGWNAPGASRQFLPYTRNTEYASKLVAVEKIPDPKPFPRHWQDHRAEGLSADGARDVIPAVAAERPDLVAAHLAAGGRVYLDTTQSTDADEEVIFRLGRGRQLVPLENGLYELINR